MAPEAVKPMGFFVGAMMLDDALKWNMFFFSADIQVWQGNFSKSCDVWFEPKPFIDGIAAKLDQLEPDDCNLRF